MATYQPETLNLSILLPAYNKIRLLSAGKYAGVPEYINVRGMTVKEIKQLTSSKVIDASAFDLILRNCIKEQIDLSKLLVQDYNWIVLNVRLQTSGSKASGGLYCSNSRCGTKYKFEYNLTDSVEASYSEDTIEETKSVELPRISELMGSVVSLEVKQFTRGDFVKIENSLKAAKDDATRTGMPLSKFPFSELLKVHIKKISGFTQTVTADQLVDFLTPDEAELIVGAFNGTTMKLEGKAPATCPVCGTKTDYEIPFTDLFF